MSSLFHRTVSDDPKFTLLRSMASFADVADGDLKAFVNAADFTERPAGFHLMDEGRFAYEVFVVLAGAVEVTRGDNLVALRGAGDVMGEIAVIENTPRTATVTAVTDVQLAVWDVATFATLMADLPTVRALIDKLIAARPH